MKNITFAIDQAAYDAAAAGVRNIVRSAMVDGKAVQEPIYATVEEYLAARVAEALQRRAPVDTGAIALREAEIAEKQRQIQELRRVAVTLAPPARL